MSEVKQCNQCTSNKVPHSQDDIYGKGIRLHTITSSGTIKGCTVCGPERHKDARLNVRGAQPAILGIREVPPHLRDAPYPHLNKVK